MTEPLGHHYMVAFRGEQCEAIVTSYDEDFETNACEIEWLFAGLTPEQHDALNVTAAEEDAISGYLVANESARLWDDGDDF